MMVRYKVATLPLAFFLWSVTAQHNDTKPPDKTLLQKSSPYSDSVAAASEHNERTGRFLPPPNGGCYECNRIPWVPIAGRNLRFPESSSHSLEVGNSKVFNFHPPIDQYGAPQAAFQFPGAGEVADFMLPPPYQRGHLRGPQQVPSTNYGVPPSSHGISPQYGPPSQNYGPPPSTNGIPSHYDVPSSQYGPPSTNYGPPSSSNGISTQYGPPSPSYGPPPSSNGNPQLNYGAPRPQPSYGPPSPTYGAPSPTFGGPQFPTNILDLSPPPFHRLPSYKPPTTYLRPVTQSFQPPPIGGGIHNLPLENNLPPARPSDSYGRPINYADSITLASDFDFEAQQSAEIKASLYHKGMTDVQVVPSVRIADYTASIEHPINLIQSPILDLNVKSIQKDEKLSSNPIVVDDDSFTSASTINATVSSPNIIRHNDKYLNKDDLTKQLIEKLLAEHKIIDDPKKQIVGIKKSVLNLKPSTGITSSYPSLPSWSNQNKTSKKLQIIIPYVKPSSNAIYNRDYTTLAPVFVPPPVTPDSINLWNQFSESVRITELKKNNAQGFKTSTEVYNNIQEWQRHKDLQEAIDDWTAQSFSNSKSIKFTKQIPVDYVTTPITDHVASASNHNEHLEDNLIITEETTKNPNTKIKFVHKTAKPMGWKDKVTIKNSTHEKIYVVTPQSYVRFPTNAPATAYSMAPKIKHGKVNEDTKMTKISVRVEPSENEKEKNIKVVYSEWPHLINDLETTTPSHSTSRHPLFGLMDLAPYTGVPKSTVETIGGHSKVVTVVSLGTSPVINSASTTPLPKPQRNETIKVSPEP